MNLLDQFAFYAASVVGTSHVSSMENGHDGFVLLKTPEMVVGIACDGCGSQPNSEVGAKLGASMVLRALTERMAVRGGFPDLSNKDLWADVKKRLVDNMLLISQMMYGYVDEALATNFLFTVIGFVITDWQSAVFNIGDGIFFVNGEKTTIEPMEGNCPAYVAYNLLETEIPIPAEKLAFSVKVFDTAQINTIAVATDGFEYAIKATGELFPGTSEVIPEILGLTSDPKYFTCPVVAQRLLRRMAATEFRMKDVNHSKRLVKFPGLLHDDVTIICGRRR